MGSLTRALLPKRLRASYGAKFLTALILVTVVAGSLGAYVYLNAGEELTEETEEELTTTASLQASQLDDWTGSTSAKTRSLGTTVSTISGRDDSYGRIQSLLAGTVDRNEHVVGAYYVDEETGELRLQYGDRSVVEESDRLRPDVTDRVADLTDGETGTVTLSDTFPAGESGSPMVMFVTETQSSDTGAVVVLASLQSLSGDVLRSPDGGRTVVTDDAGRVVMASDGAGLMATDSLASGDGEGFVPNTESENGSVAVASVAAPSHGWTVSTRVPTSEAYALQHSISNQMLAMVGLVFASLALLGLTLGRNTVRSVRDLSASAAELEAGNLDADMPTDRADEIGDLGRAFDEMRSSLQARIDEVESARQEAQTARERAQGLSDHLERKADQYQTTMATVADGDLTRRLDPESNSEAMAAVAESCNEMLDEIEATVAETKAFAAAVDDASEAAAESATEVQNASEQVTESVQEISVGADRQHDSLQSVSQEMESLSTSTEEIAATTNQVADVAEETALASRSGRAAANAAVEGMAQIEAESEEAVDAIEDLEDEMAEIDELVEFISDVANQTNMLALNANIEASRGGGGDGDGEGFAVVATQVKELATDTKDAAEDVEDRLERIRDETDRTAEEVRETKERVATNAQSVREAATALDEIAEYAQETNTGVQEISAATEEQAASTEEVVAVVEEATGIAEQTSAEAETVAAAAEEQTANLTDVSGQIERLASRARKLSGNLATFEVAATETMATSRSAGGTGDFEFADDD
ncbi:methyl-accepting chemotaxis protein [Haloarchaeobius sp. FL176]|uniref:methyl-accepting chemotaxis protein n=1 Tax=Haloarchaeobius sp. FL176 TaxID=2967129 RepID=UPI002147CB66|nr:methyl-accepting chemotaxis protein [Haloarchaeobius sp. FL176]